MHAALEIIDAKMKIEKYEPIPLVRISIENEGRWITINDEPPRLGSEPPRL